MTALSAGSTQMTFRAGFFILRYFPAPHTVPPVPLPHTKMSTLPAVSFHISGPEIQCDKFWLTLLHFIHKKILDRGQWKKFKKGR